MNFSVPFFALLRFREPSVTFRVKCEISGSVTFRGPTAKAQFSVLYSLIERFSQADTR